MPANTPLMGLQKPADGEFNWGASLRNNTDKLDQAVGTQHNLDGTHKEITAPSVSAPTMILGGVARTAWPTPGTAAQALTDTLTNGPIGNIPAGQEFAVQNSTGTKKHFAVDEATGKVTAINLAGMLGNISSPLVDIPFKRANDEKALGGVQTFIRSSTATYIDPLDGLVKTAALNTPRFEKMNDGGTGILLEGPGTNLALNSDTSIAVPTAAITNNPIGYGFANGVHMDGTVLDAPGLYTQFIIYFGAATAGSTISIYVQMDDLSAPMYGVDFSFDVDGSLVSIGTIAVKHISGYLYRVSLAMPLAVATFMSVYYNGGYSKKGFTFCGTQLEASPFATSYIPTTTAPVTRAADNLSIPLSGNFSSGNISTAVEFDSLGFDNRPNIIQTVMSNQYGNWFSPNDFSAIASIDTIGAQIPAISFNPSVKRFVYSISPNEATTLLTNMNTKAIIASNTVASPTINNVLRASSVIQIGNIFVQGFILNRPLYGHVRNLRIYDKALTPSEVEAA